MTSHKTIKDGQMTQYRPLDEYADWLSTELEEAIRDGDSDRIMQATDEMARFAAALEDWANPPTAVPPIIPHSPAERL